MTKAQPVVPFTEDQSLQEKIAVLAEHMTGHVDYGFTNDYMFRAVLQKNPIVLTEIVRVLLKIPKGNIVVCEIQNPIILGKSLESKDCILDILVTVNGRLYVNLEMQMSITIDWIKRSMYYGFSMYTNLKAGEDYSDCKPSYHIGFVKKSPFADDKRFYSNFLLMEEKSHRIYSGDFRISMVNLSYIENATDEDRENGLYAWTCLFAATEWKELIKMAQQSEVLGRAIVTLAELSEEEQIRQQCEARRKYEMDEQATAKRLKKLNEELEAKKTQLKVKETQLKTQETQIEEQTVQIQNQAAQIADAALREKLTSLLIKDNRIKDWERMINDAAFRNELLQEYKLIERI